MARKRHKISPLKRILSASKQGSKVRRLYFEKLTRDQIAASFPRIANHRHFKHAVNLTLNGVDSRTYQRLTPSAPLEKNISWCIGVIRTHKPLVQRFVKQEALVSASLLAGRDEEVTQLLNEIDSVCGLSVWSVMLRGAVYTSFDREDDKQAFCDQLISLTEDNPFLRAVFIHAYERLSSSSTITRDSRAAELQVRRSRDPDLLNLMMYRVFEDYCDFPFSYEHVLNFEKNSSIIDITKCLLNFCLYAEIGNLSEKEKRSAEHVARILANEFSYPPAQGIASAHGYCDSWRLSSTEFEILDAYTSGNYSAVESLVLADLGSITKFPIFEVFAKASAREHTQDLAGLAGSILTALRQVFLRGDDYEPSAAYLLAVTYAYSSLPWFQELRYLVLREAVFSDRERDARLADLSVKMTELQSPLKLRVLGDEPRKSFLSRCQESIGDSVTLDFFKHRFVLNEVFEEYSHNVQRDRLLKFRAVSHMEKGEADEAASVLEELSGSKDRVVQHEARALLVQALIDAARYEEAIGTFVDTVLDNSNVMHMYDTERICHVCRNSLPDERQVPVSIPVALSLHARFVDNEHDQALKFAFERFLESNGMTFPTELFDTDLKIPERQVRYFLEFVCVPSVMQLYLAFDSTSEIEVCRIDICRHLIEIGHSADTMVEEVKDRTRQLVIRDAAKKVASSRIFADTSVFRGVSGNVFAQLYERFQSLVSQGGWDTRDEDELESICNTLEDKGFKDSLHTLMLLRPLNEKNATLLDLIKRLRNEFALGERGLNSYLSTRIRHGHLPTTLRRGPASVSLFCPKSASTKGYRENVYWLERFGELSASTRSAIDRAFKDFSKEFDGLVDTINDEWLQIKIFELDITALTGKNSSGNALFDYSVTAPEAYYLGTQVTAETEYADFSKIVAAWLWRRTDQNLRRVKGRLEHEARERALEMVEELQKNVLKAAPSGTVAEEFSDAVAKAKEGVRISIETILTWFDRSENTFVTSYEIGTAIKIAADSAGVTYTTDLETGLEMKGETLSNLVDVFYILFENAVSKSRLAVEDLELHVEAKHVDGLLMMCVRNAVKPVWDVETENERLSAYKRGKSGDERFEKAAQGEGGTGFFKIRRILEHDLAVKCSMDLGFESNRSFQVLIEIEDTDRIEHHEDSTYR